MTVLRKLSDSFELRFHRIIISKDMRDDCMNMIEKLVKSGYSREIAEAIYKQYMEIEEISGKLDLKQIEENKLNFD